ncbi:MAG: hypothetical protein QOH67_4264 [Hyphomicrobiales bacterium]|jgi:hypothetical protein|nr:hypothetical protein [Hyphomicrobiales bacterium]
MDNPAIIAAIVAAMVSSAGATISVFLKWLFDDRVQEKRLRFERDVLEKRFQFERDNARQLKLIDAQSALLDGLGNVCWRWRYEATRVAYYGSASEQEQYDRAVKSYSDNIWSNLNEIRTAGTRAARLFSKTASDEIEAFYERVDDVEQDIEEALRETNLKKRKALFEAIYPNLANDTRMQIAQLVLNLAKDMDLAPRK